LRTRKWKDKEGQERTTTEIVADRMQMLGSRQGSGDAGARERSSEAKEPVPAGEAMPAKKPSGKFDDMDDDIPF
jgi:single-strand DNA-binding protein